MTQVRSESEKLYTLCQAFVLVYFREQPGVQRVSCRSEHWPLRNTPPPLVPEPWLVTMSPGAVTGPTSADTTVDIETVSGVTSVNTKTSSKQRVRNTLSQLLTPCHGHKSPNCSLNSSSNSLPLQSRTGALRINLHYETLKLKVRFKRFTSCSNHKHAFHFKRWTLWRTKLLQWVGCL